MKTGQLGLLALVSCLAAGFGYWLRSPSQDSDSFSAAQALPQLEYLVPPESFSRVENARKDLEGLCARLRMDAQGRLWRLEKSEALGAEPGSWDGIIGDLEREITEFKGNDNELDLTEDLFVALKRAGRFDRWVEVYLKALYAHPTHPVVARYAREAISLGATVGRQEDILAGLTHLSAIPYDFEGKDKVEALLIDANKSNRFTRNESARITVQP